MPPAIFSPDAQPLCGSTLSCLQNPGVWGNAPGRRQTLAPARCGTIRKPTITATGKHDHNSDNHSKSPDLKVAKPYNINSVRNTHPRPLRFSVSFRSPAWVGNGRLGRFRHPGCVIALVLIHGAPFSFTKKPPCIKPDEGAVTKQDIGDLSATPESQNAHKQFPPPRPGGVGSGRSSLGDFGGERGRAAASSAGIGVATPDKTPFQANAITTARIPWKLRAGPSLARLCRREELCPPSQPTNSSQGNQ
jgi:hypothetical protein